MARVQVPAAIFVTILSSIAIVTMFNHAKTYFKIILSLLILLSVLPSAFEYFQPTNAEQEERLIQMADRSLANGPFDLVRLNWPDLDRAKKFGGHTHYHFPDYLFNKKGSIKPLAEWFRAPQWKIPAYFFWGIRCYASFLPEETPAPQGSNLHPSCNKMQTRFRLEPVFEEIVPNYGNLTINYYGTSSTFKVGLYRIFKKH